MKYGDRRYPIGSVVLYEGLRVTVIGHGRSVEGVYTRIRFENGDVLDVHRSYLRAL